MKNWEVDSIAIGSRAEGAEGCVKVRDGHRDLWQSVCFVLNCSWGLKSSGEIEI